MEWVFVSARFGMTLCVANPKVDICQITLENHLVSTTNREIVELLYLRDANTMEMVSDHLYTLSQMKGLVINPQTFGTSFVPFIEGKRKNQLLDDVSEIWVRNGIEFRTVDLDLANIPGSELNRLADFCRPSGLETDAHNHFADVMQLSKEKRIIFVVGPGEDISGFAIYSLDNTRDRLRKTLEDNGWMPEAGLPDQWEALVRDMIETSGIDPGEMEEDTLDDPSKLEHPYHRNFVDVFESLKNVLVVGEEALKMKLKEISTWIVYTRKDAFSETHGEGDSLETYLHLVCADPNMAGNGLLKGMLRYLLRKTVLKARDLNREHAYIKLVASDEMNEAMYAALGFIRDEDSEAMYTPDLLSEDVLLNVHETHSSPKKGRTKKK